MTITPQRFTKRPVTIEAIQWDGTPSGATPIIGWILSHDHSADYCAPGEWDHETNAAYIRITTLEGNMLASRSDWIIRGVQGEFYPCKPDIFEATYEPAAKHQGAPNADGPTDAEVQATGRAIFEEMIAVLLEMLDPEDREGVPDPDWDGLNDENQAKYGRYARAALLAAREARS